MSGDTLLSWGRYPYLPQVPLVSSWRTELSSDIYNLTKCHGSTLPFGMGRSYGDSCLALSNHVLCTRRLNRFISINWKTGIIVAESGVTLEDILNISIPNGWFLAVTPGTKYVTLGGAIANDVHGKNHHVRGTFGCHVLKLSLVRSDRTTMHCSVLENKEMFEATIGGLGLTGVIEWVELQLIPIKSSNVNTTTVRFNSLSEFIELSNELDKNHEYSVAWIDCLASGKELGRGVFIVGDHSQDGDLTLKKKNKLRVPFTPPISVINKVTLPLLNSLYYKMHKPDRHLSTVNYDPFFYPLDGILYWNRAYGSKGFQQYQCVIPEENAEYAICELLKVIANSGNGSFLAVLKRCGSIVSPGLLSFPLSGLSLALDFPQSDSLLSEIFPLLDQIVIEANGRLYPAKDAHMSGKDFRLFYKEWEKIEALRDPGIISHFWNRVTST